MLLLFGLEKDVFFQPAKVVLVTNEQGEVNVVNSTTVDHKNLLWVATVGKNQAQQIWSCIVLLHYISISVFSRPYQKLLIVEKTKEALMQGLHDN